MEHISGKPHTTPKDFFLWAGAMVALYVSVFSLMTLLFTYIDYAFPDALATYYGDPYSGTIRFAMASLIVLFPTYVLLMQLVRRGAQKDPSRMEIWVRRWALFLTLFVAGASIAVDLIVLINTFLGGDITMRFVLKVAVVFLVAAAFFMHFLADLWGYWQKFPKRLQVVAVAACLLVLTSIISGFFIIGSPASARLYSFDDQKVNDLQSVQWQIVNYWQAKQKLPSALTDLNDTISGFTMPKDAQTGSAYTYEVTGGTTFKLCATFNLQSRNLPTGAAVAPRPIGVLDDNWQHGGGSQCFTRTIDPEKYPPLTKSSIN